MRRPLPFFRRLAAVALALTLPACADLEPLPVPAPVLSCDSRAPSSLDATPLETISADSARIFLDSPGSDGNLLALLDDVPATLAALWPSVTDIRVTEGAGTPEPTPLTLWISTSEQARAAAGSPALDDGYALRRIDSEGGITLLVYAPDTRNLAHGAYALLELLGARFFHPMQDFIPSFEKPRIPVSLDKVAKPWVKVRGTQLHLLHPIEYFESFQNPGPAHLAEAKRVIDWLVKTGQNHLQWWLLGNNDWTTYREHAKAIVDYAHSRGVTVFAVVQLWGGASLQNGYALVDDETVWQTQLEAGIDQILEVPFDGIEMGLGEFLAADPAELITWLDHGTAYASSKGARLSVVNHVGNYPELYVPYKGKTEFYYFLPGYADERLINNVHTVFFFDLYREGGMYAHPNFHAHRDFLLSQLPKRPVRYEPESAYWVTADIDVPVFLPEYIYSRWIDVHNLHDDIEKKGLPPLEGHIMFSSGHEWGYYLTDYLTAHMLWSPGDDFAHFLSIYTSIYGSCAADVNAALQGFIDVQTKYLFEKKLVPYVSGEDTYDDLGNAIGKETQLRRVPFEALLTMSEAERATFETDTLGGLRGAVSEIEPIEAIAVAACDGADQALIPYCSELRDGVQIVRLRLLHSIRLYEAMLDHVRGGAQAQSLLAEAGKVTDEAKAVIDRREPFYRFDVERLTGAYPNLSIYKFGYLRQAHTQCLWRRQEDEVAFVIENGMGPSPFGLDVRPCTD